MGIVSQIEDFFWFQIVSWTDIPPADVSEASGRSKADVCRQFICFVFLSFALLLKQQFSSLKLDSFLFLLSPPFIIQKDNFHSPYPPLLTP